MVYFIAEAGVNHNGSVKKAKELVQLAAEAGADAVKFQSFVTSKLIAGRAAKAPYQMETGNHNETQLEMLTALELSQDDQHEIANYAKTIGIDFLSTPFDSESLNFLVNSLGLGTLKVASSDLATLPFLTEVGLVCKKVILSTGMSTFDDIKRGLGALQLGFLGSKAHQATISACLDAYESKESKGILKERVVLMHCISEYPTKARDSNLLAIVNIQRSFGIPTGFSDHSEGTHMVLAATALGATHIEKHFTLDKNASGPDHKASLSPAELHKVISEVRDVAEGLGDGIKRITAGELLNLSAARKSVVAQKTIRAGDIFSAENITVKRPGIGLPAAMFAEMIGMTAKRDYDADDLI